MIIANGIIQIKQKAPQNVDPVTGYPRKAESSWGEPIPCQWLQKQKNLLALINNEPHTVQHYDILIDETQIEGEQLRLTDDTGRHLGDFSIIALEELRGVCQIRISV